MPRTAAVRLVPALAFAVMLLTAAPGPSVESMPELLVARPLAEDRGLAVGDLVRLASDPQGDGEAFRVAGIYEPVPDPLLLSRRRWEVRLHLPHLLAVAADGPLDQETRETIHAVNLLLRDPSRAEEIARSLEARMPGLVVLGTEGGGGPFVALERFHLAVSIVTVLGATAFLLALIVMRADERREIAGILRLVGFARTRILVQVLVEGFLVAFLGALFGVLLAWATQGLANAFFQWRYDTALVFVRITPGIAAACIALAVPLGALAGLVASWALLRRELPELLER